ncbi:MAG TPA: hypothetical protein VFG68_14295 [Fimbriiglobus sp.]|nr:hypothetical protein [Fimbriiglobus sp.]
MTESEWLTSTDGSALYDHLFPYHIPPRGRKLQLYLCALGRAVWDRLPAACRAAIAFAERDADDPRADPYTCHAIIDAFVRMALAFANPEAIAQCERDLRAVGLEVATGPPWRGSAEEWTRYIQLALLPNAFSGRPRPALAGADHRPDLIRCVFGNPFRPTAFDPQWRTGTAVGLARTMYESRDFGAMPVLADALEEAGCDSPDALAHCRGESPHACGCWVVDGVLGK